MKKSLPTEGVPGKKIPTKEELLRLLKHYFDYPDFRGKQLEAINAVLSGRDCFCLMPTGGGKSMCYQIPAVAKDGIVLVISPLIALMENQVETLKKKGISADFLSSTQSAHTKQKIHEDLNSGNPSLRLLYVTPELVATVGFMAKLSKLYDRGLLSLIAIDEAHCISSWGHDFRPSYRKLSSLRGHLPGVPIIALTATAIPKVQSDVMKSLCLQQPLVLKSSFNRPNIFYEVRYKDLLDDSYTDLANLLKSSGNVCSIIYCLERSACDDLSSHLSQKGISSAAYHAGLNSKLRSAVLDDWLSSRLQVVVATVAFGMGIDRKDVRIVCHLNIPKSMEAFYQESGRAGRDQLPSRSVLYYGIEDRKRMEFILGNASQKKSKATSSTGSAEKSLAAFKQVVEYCESSSCRRKKILESFGEHISASVCQKSCDSCKSPGLVLKHLDELKHASDLLRKDRIFPGFIKSSVGYTSDDHKTEFWNREDEASLSNEEVSGSDGEAEVNMGLTRSKMTKNLGLDKKFEVLQRAEEAYYKNQTLNKQTKGLGDKKEISRSLRDASKSRLLTALNLAKERLSDLILDFGASAIFLELECFKKYEKVGKTFYNSQIAATVRWLSSSSVEQIYERLGNNKASAATVECQSNSLEASDDPASIQNAVPTEAFQTEYEVDDQSKCSYGALQMNSEEKICLPPIPSFSEFAKRKGNGFRGSSSTRTSGSRKEQSIKMDKRPRLQ